MLVAFPKPIVAAVQGDVLGMGVTILPLFDIVIAQLGSSFVAPYGHFGYLPEALGAFSSGVRSLKAKTVNKIMIKKYVHSYGAYQILFICAMHSFLPHHRRRICFCKANG